MQTEEAKLNIKKLRLELKALSKEDISSPKVKKLAKKIAKSPKVIIRRSNFYEKLNKYNKVKALSYTQLDSENKILDEEKKVKRKKFKKFIIHSKNLKPLVVDDAEIEIVAPVLKEGNYKWKGIYKNETFSFTMKDKKFRHQVISKEVSFQNGATINAVLETHRKLDEAGEVVITGYSVTTVISKHDERQLFETPQGKEYMQAKKYIENQADFFN